MPVIVLNDFLKKVLPYVLAALAVVGLGVYVYSRGYGSGSDTVKLKWDEDRIKARAEYDSMVLESAKRVAKQEESHKVEQERVAHELEEVRKQGEVAVAAVRDSYAQRLLQSDRRALVYQRQAEAGAAARGDLAGHAAELDRALEEGVGLVGELQATLGFREHQLILLGAQIRNDRRACEEQTP